MTEFTAFAMADESGHDVTLLVAGPGTPEAAREMGLYAHEFVAHVELRDDDWQPGPGAAPEDDATERKGREAALDRRAVVLARYAADLESGQAFAMAAISHRSRRGYMPPVGRRTWAHAVATLADMAQRSDALAQVASAIVGSLNLYGTDADLCAKVYERAAAAIGRGYDDVIGRSGPEAGRRSDHHRPFTIGECALIACYLMLATGPASASVTRLGWALETICEAEHVLVPRGLKEED